MRSTERRFTISPKFLDDRWLRFRIACALVMSQILFGCNPSAARCAQWAKGAIRAASRESAENHPMGRSLPCCNCFVVNAAIGSSLAKHLPFRGGSFSGSPSKFIRKFMFASYVSGLRFPPAPIVTAVSMSRVRISCVGIVRAVPVCDAESAPADHWRARAARTILPEQLVASHGALAGAPLV
jgi:hypothetical protein